VLGSLSTDEHLLACTHLLLRHAPPATTCTLSLHDALPICRRVRRRLEERLLLEAADPRHERAGEEADARVVVADRLVVLAALLRSEEHTSELQSRFELVCRLRLEKKNRNPARQPLLACCHH